MKKILIIAANDPLGYSGIAADLRSCYALGALPFVAITANTSQNSRAVFSINTVSKKSLISQLDAILTEHTVDAMKIGLVADKDFFKILENYIEKYRIQQVVLDPVFGASSGTLLIRKADREYLAFYLRALKKILPKIKIITPNFLEARQLTSGKTAEVPDLASKLLELGCEFIVVKGGHKIGSNDEKVTDYFIDKNNKIITTEHPLISTANSRGSGCSFATAMACFLAKGDDPESAFLKSSDFVAAAFQRAKEMNFLPSVHGPVWVLPAWNKFPNNTENS